MRLIIVLLIFSSSWLYAQDRIDQLMLNDSLIREVELREFTVNDSSINHFLDSISSFNPSRSLDSTKMEVLVLSDISAFTQVVADNEGAMGYIGIMTQYRTDILLYSRGVIGYFEYGQKIIFLNNSTSGYHMFSPTGYTKNFKFLSLKNLKSTVDDATLVKLTSVLTRDEYKITEDGYKWVGSVGD